MKKIRITKSTFDSMGTLLPEGCEFAVPDDVSEADAGIIVKAGKAEEVEVADS